MKTELVYLKDAYKKELESSILDVEVVNDDLAKLILDKTIFYVEGGGQPADKGVIIINDVNYKVKQVRLEKGEVKHYINIDSTIPKANTDCFQEIDWNFRYKNMQNHTAGHIIDWAISELKLHNTKLTPHNAKHYDNPFIIYIGSVKSIDKSDIQKRVNKIIENELEINTKFVSYDELVEEALYTFPNLPKDKPLRIIQLEGYKPVPDGGTILKNTAELKPVVIEEINSEDKKTKILYSVSLEDISIENNEDNTKNEDTKMDDDDVQNIISKLEKIETQSIEELKSATTLPMIDKLKINYLGRKSDLVDILRSLKEVPYDSRAKVGKKANILKNKLENKFEAKKEKIEKEKMQKALKEEWIDVTEPEIKPNVGNTHPITQMLWRVTDVFESMGFQIVEATEIDNDFNHFTALNIPENHPARDMWDTFWTEDNMIATAHTSTMQNRILTNLEPPIRAIIPGRCFRNEATDKSHEHTFYQVEGVYLGKDITLTNLISTLKTFLNNFFEEEIEIKIQPTYFPFVEPAIEIMMKRPGHKKKSKYDNDEWLEVLPCGPIHPNVLKAANIDPEEYSGFAWGLGLDRLVMVKYGIDDIRHFHDGDLRFLKQF
jgi:phenylalanyl-tRNA synthetase alpha chain